MESLTNLSVDDVDMLSDEQMRSYLIYYSLFSVFLFLMVLFLVLMIFQLFRHFSFIFHFLSKIRLVISFQKNLFQKHFLQSTKKKTNNKQRKQNIKSSLNRFIKRLF